MGKVRTGVFASCFLALMFQVQKEHVLLSTHMFRMIVMIKVFWYYACCRIVQKSINSWKILPKFQLDAFPTDM